VTVAEHEAVVALKRLLDAPEYDDAEPAEDRVERETARAQAAAVIARACPSAPVVDAPLSEHSQGADPREHSYALLLSLLESADRGSSELDAQVAAAIGWRQMPDIAPCEPPPYSQSLDAALSLVPEWCAWSVGCEIDFTPTARVFGHDIHKEDFAATPALALCLAALRARQAKP
jgi:hypothetical protein